MDFTPSVPSAFRVTGGHVRRFIHSLSALTLLAHLGLAQAAGVPAGTVITNVATGSADPLITGQPPIAAQSNLVSTTVSPVCAVSVTPDGTVGQPGQQQTILPGESALFAYRVINSGNVAFDVPLSVRIPGESAFTPTHGPLPRRQRQRPARRRRARFHQQPQAAGGRLGQLAGAGPDQ